MKDIYLRIILAISLDGKIANFKGDKAQLGGTGDRDVLEESLAWADATLMGAETLRKHKSTCLIHKDELIHNRIKDNRLPQPISIVISRKNKYSIDYPFFKQPICRWLITNKKLLETMNDKNLYNKIIPLEEYWSKTLLDLSKKGISKLLILGGAKLIGSLLLEDQVNELQLTLTPKLIGGDFLWLPKKIRGFPKVFSESNSWVLKENRILEGSEIMLRYYRNKK